MDKKLLTLSAAVLGELNKEKNASALVDVLLGQFYGVPVQDEGTGGLYREEVKLRLAEMEANPDDVVENIVTPVHVAVENPVEEVPVEEVVEPVAPVEEVSTSPVEEPAPEPVVEPVPEPVVEPVVEEATPAEDLPINVNGQPGGVCEFHGAFVGAVCIDCL